MTVNDLSCAKTVLWEVFAWECWGEGGGGRVRYTRTSHAPSFFSPPGFYVDPEAVRQARLASSRSVFSLLEGGSREGEQLLEATVDKAKTKIFGMFGTL